MRHYGCEDCRRMVCICDKKETLIDVFETEIHEGETYWVEDNTGEIVADENIHEHATEMYYTRKTR